MERVLKQQRISWYTLEALDTLTLWRDVRLFKKEFVMFGLLNTVVLYRVLIALAVAVCVWVMATPFFSGQKSIAADPIAGEAVDHPVKK